MITAFNGLFWLLLEKATLKHFDPHPVREMTACRNKLASMIVFRFHFFFFFFFFSESHEKVSPPNIWLDQMPSRRLRISEQLALIGGW